MKNLVEDHLLLAQKIAYKKKRSFPKIDIDELKSAAYMGLVEAASRYDEKYGVAFSTFAYPRISGSILDYLRELGIFKKRYEVLEDVVAKTDDSVEELFEHMVRKFDPQEKDIMRKYFIDEYSMKELGQQYHLSEGRISQLIAGYKKRINFSEAA